MDDRAASNATVELKGLMKTFRGESGPVQAVRGIIIFHRLLICSYLRRNALLCVPAWASAVFAPPVAVR